ncbi:hypothetical protein B2K_40070 [Paenibacillus mucilaginosus K02]|uniref:Uncharacterized protein n=2 Tax=Paenibacillus mucilaginosus TaxID=61624 RepID=R9ULQ0_9BACL|nr:hypothetical protein [Paenibacillus mucilaginosus]AEI44674.1 hypothetical protein KNP414_06150 [Paenibacillus mucilaginosus KNP414]AGN70779.1 hypothetical protein B2K_40070 [Paenibacillus mucilaginosus K02]
MEQTKTVENGRSTPAAETAVLEMKCGEERGYNRSRWNPIQFSYERMGE